MWETRDIQPIYVLSSKEPAINGTIVEIFFGNFFALWACRLRYGLGLGVEVGMFWRLSSSLAARFVAS